MWTYSQSTGKLLHDGALVGIGYSGHDSSLNCPDAEALYGLGPIPRGEWTIGSFFDDPGGKGPIVAHLTPVAGTETFGRSGFMIHGDNGSANHSASHGCIILSRPYRIAIRDSGDKSIIVTE
jgi:hypothetical protein